MISSEIWHRANFRILRQNQDAEDVALELTESTVKVRLLRARLALRERLTKRFGDAQRVMIPNRKHA